MNLVNVVESVFTFAVVEGAASLSSGYTGAVAALPVALTAAGLVYKVGISSNEIAAILDDTASILENGAAVLTDSSVPISLVQPEQSQQVQAVTVQNQAFTVGGVRIAPIGSTFVMTTDANGKTWYIVTTPQGNVVPTVFDPVK